MLAYILSDITLNKIGVEIGGPSNTGDILYQKATTIDNIIFSKNFIYKERQYANRWFIMQKSADEM